MHQPNPTKGEAPVASTTEASKTENQNHQVKEIVLSDSTNSLIPVNFHGTELYLVNHDGQPWVAMKPMVEAMGLAWQSQHRKMQDRFKSTITEMVTVANDGKQRSMTCLLLRKLPGWLNTIMPGKIKDPTIRAKIIQYQNECDDALWDYWNNGIAVNPRMAYAVNPDDVLTAAQAETLRLMLKTKADLLPKQQQGSFMMKGWSKLKSHYKVGYRQIPQSEYTEAMSIVARHVTEWEVLDALPNGETINEQVTRLVQQLSAPNGYPVNVLFPLYKVICEKLGRPNAVLVDIQNLIDLYVDLGKIRNRIDGFGTLKSDLPPEWWQQQRIA